MAALRLSKICHLCNDLSNISKTNAKLLRCSQFFPHPYPQLCVEKYECIATTFKWDPSTWKTDYKNLFELFKVAITKSVTLHFPDYSLPWVIRSDSSDHAVGAVLFQEYTDTNGTLIHQPIAFASHKYSGACCSQLGHFQARGLCTILCSHAVQLLLTR